MKKIISIYIAFAFIMSTSAQTTKKVEWGIKTGLNFSSFSVSKTAGENYTSLSRITGGAFSTIHLSKSFAIEPQLLYNNLGSKISDNVNAELIRLGYVSVPVLAKIYSGGFNFFTGPQIGFLTSAKSKFNNEAEEDIKADINSTDFSGIVGVGYIFNSKINLAIHYQKGFSNILKDPSSGRSIKNNAFVISIGYTIN